MIYFDTDVRIHLLVQQDAAKHQKAQSLYRDATAKGQFFISLLCLQEMAFVLQRLGQNPDDISGLIKALMPFQPVPYTGAELLRGVELAKIVGFQNINDCIHTAIAETHCNEMYTFNSADFKRIKKRSVLNVTIF